MERDGPGTTDVWLGVSRERGRPTREYSHEIRVHSVPSDFSDGGRPKWDEALAGQRGRREEGQGPATASLRRRRCCAGELRPRGRAGEDGRKKDGRAGARRWRNPAGRARCLAAHRAGESRRLAGLLWASASTPPRRPPSAGASWARGELGGRRHGRARGKEARGELAGWRRGASSLGKPGAGGGDEVGGWDRRDKERKEKKEKIKKS